MINSSTLILTLFAMMAAQADAADAITRGDTAAKALLEDGRWSLIQHSVYLAKAPTDRLLFWKSGAPLQQLQSDAKATATPFPQLVPLVEQARQLFLKEYAEQIQKGQLAPPATPPGPATPPPPATDTGLVTDEAGPGYGTIVIAVLVGGGVLWGLSKLLGGR